MTFNHHCKIGRILFKDKNIKSIRVETRDRLPTDKEINLQHIVKELGCASVTNYAFIAWDSSTNQYIRIFEGNPVRLVDALEYARVYVMANY